MDANTLITLLQTTAFPIAACVAMGWYVKYITDQHRQDRQKSDCEHKETIEKITEALNNNTLAIQKLSERLVYWRDDIDDHK